MQNPLVRRAIYSFLLTMAGLSLIYYLIAIFPNPALWMSNTTSNLSMLVMVVVMLIIYGLPAWAMCYLLLGLLGIPEVDPRRSASKPWPRRGHPRS